MAIEFVCPACGGTLSVGNEQAGQVIRCGGCMSMLRVPPAPESAPAAPPSPFDPPPGPDPAPFPFPAEPRRSAPRPRDRRDDYDRPPPRDDNYDDRPPPARRLPPPASGKSPLFWVLLIGGALFVLSLVCCGGLLMMIPRSQWQVYRSEKGGFKVDLPAPARTDLSRVPGVKLEPGMSVEGTLVPTRGEEYAVVYRDLTDAERKAATDDKLITAALDAIRGDPDVEQVRNEKAVKVNNGLFPAREIEFRDASGGWYAARVIVADTRIYVLVAGGRGGRTAMVNARRFLISFEITDPKLLAAAKKRADDEDKRKAEEKETEEKRKAAAKEAETKRKEVIRVAEEKAKKELKHREVVRGRNAAFLGTGVAPDAPDAAAVRAGVEVFVLSFEKADGTGVEPGPGALRLTPAVHGPGVRGKAAYLLPRGSGSILGLHGPSEAAIAGTLKQPAGCTVAGWVRVRYAPVTLVTVGGLEHLEQFDRPLLEVTVGRTHVSAKAGSKDPPVELKHPWTRDEKWHHVAVVYDAGADGPTATLYLDGEPVASAPVPRLEFPKSLVAAVGVLKDKDPVWLGPPDADGIPGPPARDELVGAVDECAFFGAPLTAAEVRRLAGRAKPGDDAPARPVAPPPREKPADPR